MSYNFVIKEATIILIIRGEGDLLPRDYLVFPGQKSGFGGYGF
jgi:hypothetical protein